MIIALVVGAFTSLVFAGCSASDDLLEGDRSVAREQMREVKEREFKAREDAREIRRKERAERRAKIEADRERRIKEIEATLKSTSRPKKRVRKVRRFRWESPAETRGKLWNVPLKETVESLETALLRVCIAESGGNPFDCTGIWQVVKNNRMRSCNRGMIRRITECHDDGGETYLSALRRHQRHVLGYIKARNRRATWIRNLETDCEMPAGWHHSENRWDARYGSKVCPQTLADVRQLIAGKLPEHRPGARTSWLPGRPVTWGGACELKGGACDDDIACQRVLARIPDTNTRNAFWCRVGNSGCRQDPEPICIARGYQYEKSDFRGRKVWVLSTKSVQAIQTTESKLEKRTDPAVSVLSVDPQPPSSG